MIFYACKAIDCLNDMRPYLRKFHGLDDLLSIHTKFTEQFGFTIFMSILNNQPAIYQ